MIDSPGREQRCVRRLMTAARSISSTGEFSGAGVYAELEAFGMSVIGERLHSRRELVRVGFESLVGFSCPMVPLPSIVQVEVFEPGVSQSAAHHVVDEISGEGFVDLVTELVPGAESHRRGLCEAIADASGIAGGWQQASSEQEKFPNIHLDLTEV